MRILKKKKKKKEKLMSFPISWASSSLVGILWEHRLTLDTAIWIFPCGIICSEVTHNSRL
ncbi:unnamed protein product [Spirodela intermedia]|uniref:Uncharacterized protein n=1 Tax=Spirodela intermedia TaxID=51605 RepID=A0A7I8IJN8_SPIIN|nr:unnamed protein product [Spirodela intermedia]CAA6657970.1 unnamed protein product [Spirodela intermedia]